MTRACLQMEARLNAIEKWILENNEVLSDHAEKLDNAKLGTLRLGTALQKPLEKHDANIAEMQGHIVRMQKVLDDNDVSLKGSLEAIDTRIREQFLITQQYADKGDEELKRILEAVAQAAGAGGGRARTSRKRR